MNKNESEFIKDIPDAMEPIKKGHFELGGIIGETADFIQSFQLLNTDNWKRFVEQFKLHSDSESKGWRGEYWGKMMRGATFVYSLTESRELYRVLTEAVKDMLTAEDKLGRISTYDTEHEFRGWDIWCRKYVLLGMQYYYEICCDEELKEKLRASMCRQVDYLISKLGYASDGKLPITSTSTAWRGLNSSSILEPVVRLYRLTHEKSYLDFAEHIIKEGGTSICNIFELAYEDKTDPYQYPVVKAYEMISCFEGVLEYYRVTGNVKYRDAVVRFAERLSKSDITIIGSAGCTHELLDHSALRQTDTAYSGIMQETCVTVTWMKFCWQLTRLTGDPKYVDMFERALYNAYLGAVNTEKKIDHALIDRLNPNAVKQALPFDSYSSLLPNTRGRGIGGLQFMPDGSYYGCCACIGAAGIGLTAKLALMKTENGFAFNLYAPGKLEAVTPGGKRIAFKTETDYPKSGRISILLELEESESFELWLRIPEWSDNASVKVNGVSSTAKKGYWVIDRHFCDRDCIELELDMNAHVIHAPVDPRDIVFTKYLWKFDFSIPTVVEASPDAEYHIAIQKGPLILARDARLGENVDEPVNISYDKNDRVVLDPTAKHGIGRLAEYSVPQRNGTSFTVIDYASAGKTWDEASKYGCWLPIEH